MKQNPIETMMEYYKDEGYISHTLRVHGYAMGIARGEGIQGSDLNTLLLAALFHDVGIPVGLREEGSSAGPVQERLGAPVAMELAKPHVESAEALERIGFMVGNHHSFQVDGGILLQILFEADWLVNLSGEDKAPVRATVYKKNFKTATGKRFFRCVYPGVPTED